MKALNYQKIQNFMFVLVPILIIASMAFSGKISDYFLESSNKEDSQVLVAESALLEVETNSQSSIVNTSQPNNETTNTPSSANPATKPQTASLNPVSPQSSSPQETSANQNTPAKLSCSIELRNVYKSSIVGTYQYYYNKHQNEIFAYMSQLSAGAPYFTQEGLEAMKKSRSDQLVTIVDYEIQLKNNSLAENWDCENITRAELNL